jgi:sugar phosphate isomerase/epimerase
MTRSLSLAALTVLELAPPDMVSCAAEAGYAMVGLRLVPPTATEPTYPMIGDTPMVREVARRLADTGVRVLDIEILKLAPETDVRAFLPVLETGARLGATEVLVASYDPDEARFTERFEALCDLGAPLGLAMNLEPMPWTNAPDLATAARLVARATRANGGIVIDPIHFDRAGNVPADIAAVPASRLRYLQLCDAPAERPRDTEGLLHQARAERLMPGDGQLDLAGILRAVPPGIPIGIEIPMRELARTLPAVARTRRMREKTEAVLASLDVPARS